MKDHSMRLAKAAANAHEHSYGSHTKSPRNMMGKGRGTPAAPMNQGGNQPPPKQPTTFKIGSKSPSNYGNSY